MRKASGVVASISLMVATAPPAAVAAPASPIPGRHACAITGFSLDTDPAGLNVRAGPSIKSRIVGNLPMWKGPDAKTYARSHAPAFRIVEAQDGWVRIADVEVASNDDGASYSAVPVTGWISGKMVGFVAQTQVGFLRPDPASPALIKEPQSMDALRTKPGLTDCVGEWALVDFIKGPTVTRAWVRGICGNPETPCHVSMGDNIEPR